MGLLAFSRELLLCLLTSTKLESRRSRPAYKLSLEFKCLLSLSQVEGEGEGEGWEVLDSLVEQEAAYCSCQDPTFAISSSQIAVSS